MKDLEYLKNALLDIFMKNVKAGTSWGNVTDLDYHFDRTGYTGIFTGLEYHYDHHYDLLETITEEWDNH